MPDIPTREAIRAAVQAAVDETDCKLMYPGFTVACDACGSRLVTLENTLGFSPECGGYGSVSLVCTGCGTSAELVQG